MSHIHTTALFDRLPGRTPLELEAQHTSNTGPGIRPHLPAKLNPNKHGSVSSNSAICEFAISPFHLFGFEKTLCCDTSALSRFT